MILPHVKVMWPLFDIVDRDSIKPLSSIKMFRIAERFSGNSFLGIINCQIHLLSFCLKQEEST